MMHHRALAAWVLVRVVGGLHCCTMSATTSGRRAALRSGTAAALGAASAWRARSAVGVPAAPGFDYFSECAVVPRALVINSVDVAATAAFFGKALGVEGSTPTADGRGVRLAFGPTALSRPADFYPGISTFEVDGGHFALEIRPAAEAATLSERVAYVQLTLPTIRASKILDFGGEVVDAYGVWDIVAPGSVPLRLLVGDERRDRVMYVAYKVANVKNAEAFYAAYGFARAPYPRARPPTTEESPFDPNPPKGAVYLQSCEDTVGVLLVPDKKRKKPPAAPDAFGPLKLKATPALAGTAVDPDGNALELLAGDVAA